MNEAKEWTIEVTDYSLNLAKKCHVKRTLHEEASAWYDKYYNIITICSIVMNLVIAAISALPFDGPWFKYGVTVLALVSAAVSAIIKKLGYEGLMQRHLLAAQQFLDLREMIEVELTLPVAERFPGMKAFIHQISKAYRTIVFAAPGVVTRRLVEGVKLEDLCDAMTPLKAEFGEQACEV